MDDAVLHLAVHGPSARVHASVPGREFDDVKAAFEAADVVTVETAVTRSNARSLGALAQWLLRMHRGTRIERWTLCWPGTSPAGLSLPRLGMVTPRVLHAAELARRGGLTVETRGLPPCVLGPHARHAAAGVDVGAFAERCEGCGVRKRCGGVPRGYLEEFGRDLELRPLG